MAQLGGVYRGVVINNADPQGDGRVQVRLPGMPMGGSAWAPVCAALGAPRNTAGPSIGSDVVVAFENGSADHPIVLGVIQG